MSNKLFTEEQLKKALRLTLLSDKPRTENDIIDLLTPIELPSDEEIDNASLIFSNDRVEFIKGAKWVLDKIQGGNNEH